MSGAPIGSGMAALRATATGNSPPSPIEIALDLAARDIPSFPCAANKRPAIREDEGGHGFHDATTDPDALWALFARAPHAKLVGVPTGPRSGIDILDVDPRHDGHVWEAANSAQLPDTRIHQTGGGGRHYAFQHADGVGNRVGCPAPGVDVRGEGGYAIWPPSRGYTVASEAAVAPWPPWLLELVRKPPAAPRPAFVASDPGKITDKRMNGLVRSLLDRVSRAPEGLKHNALLRIARTLGGYQHLLDYTEAQLVGMLLDALPDTVIDWKNAGKTARDGLQHGALSPLQLEERPLPPRRTGHTGDGAAVPKRVPPAIEGEVSEPESEPDERGGEERLSSPEPERQLEPDGKNEKYGPPTEDDVVARIVGLAALRQWHEFSYDQIEKAQAKQLEVSRAALKKRVKQAQHDANMQAEAKAGSDTVTLKGRLTGAARQAEIERLADLKEIDPIEYDDQREAAAVSMGCRGGTLEDVVDKLIEDRVAERRLNNPPPASGPEADTPEVTALIDEFNAKYFVLNETGKTVIYAPRRDHQLHRDYFERITFDDFQRLYLNRFVKTGVSETTGEPIYSQAANVWLRHRNRKQYVDGMVFDPSGRQQPDDVLNLWQGFGVDAKPGSCRLFKEHLRNVICGGDANLYEYVLDWCADAVQHPDRRGQVALVLCGPEGTGKGIFAHAMRRLFGQHGLAISNAKHLIGHFNAHLRDVVLLFADEAFYAGDRAHTSILKSIITESQMMVEPKYQNAVSAKNFLHIIMASNEPWVVPASLDSRRFAVIAVALSRMGDLAYFAAIQHELEHGGYEALLAELHDRVPFGDIRQIPITDALITQRKLSLDTTEKWWLECLSRGFVFVSELGQEAHFAQWHDVLATDVLFASYEKFCRAHHERHPLGRELLGRWLQKNTGCKPVKPTRSVVGEHITDATTSDSNYTSTVRELVWRDRAYGYHIGSLDTARATFLKATKLAVEWPQEDPPP